MIYAFIMFSVGEFYVSSASLTISVSGSMGVLQKVLNTFGSELNLGKGFSFLQALTSKYHNFYEILHIHNNSQRTLTMFVGVVALRYQHHATHVDNGVS